MCLLMELIMERRRAHFIKDSMYDVGALEEKIKHVSDRKSDFEIGKEAEDYSNNVVQMKASFFISNQNLSMNLLINQIFSKFTM